MTTRQREATRVQRAKYALSYYYRNREHILNRQSPTRRPGQVGRPRRDPLERVLARVEQHHGCWIWTGPRSDGGYGSLTVNGQHRAAHRVLYERMIGPIAAGLQLDHLCRNRACVNPMHLDPVTCRENMRRGVSFTGHHAKQTSCIHGHPFDEANTIVWRGHRLCRACRKAISAKQSAARKAERRALGCKPRASRPRS